jgi:formate--tetrahydrofolate ligase
MSKQSSVRTTQGKATFEANPIGEVAASVGIREAYLESFGRYKAKVSLDLLSDGRRTATGKYILVTAVTPTPLGEGKTTTTIGLGMALSKLGKKAVIALRQSSLGPTFGIKGGGAGGGKAQIIPLEESILHLTGDLHAVAQAHNQIAALTDNAWFHGNKLDIAPEKIQIRRVVDVNDRFLRFVSIGQGGEANGIPRNTGFDITTASELMAILALVDGDSNLSALKDLRARIGRMVVAFTKDNRPITAEEIKGAGAATVIMREALKPTLMQTGENTPVLIHAGPFANIAHGCSSILADRIGLKVADYLVTEGGFAADMGAEKFFDIKCRTSGLAPSAAVLVTTIRAMKMHTGKYKVTPGKPLPAELLQESPADVLAGCDNLRKQIANIKVFGVPVVVAINAFPEDKPTEVEVIRQIAKEAGAFDVAVSRVFAEGGAGGLELAEMVVRAAEQGSNFKLLYPNETTIKNKIHTLATTIYGASSVEYSQQAEEQVTRFESLGYGTFPICMAKTHLSISHDPNLKGAPKDYAFPIREVRASVGAGFIYPIAGSMMTMPGLGPVTNAESIDIDEKGQTVGLF